MVPHEGYIMIYEGYILTTYLMLYISIQRRNTNKSERVMNYKSTNLM